MNTSLPSDKMTDSNFCCYHSTKLKRALEREVDWNRYAKKVLCCIVIMPDHIHLQLPGKARQSFNAIHHIERILHYQTTILIRFFFFIRTFLIALIHFYWGGAEITCRNFSPGTHRNSIVIGLWCYRKNDKRSSAMILRYKGCLLSFHLKSNKVKRLTYSNDQGAAGQIKNASFLILHVHSKCSQISHSHSCSSISERLLLIQSTYLIFCLNNFVQKYTE